MAFHAIRPDIKKPSRPQRAPAKATCAPAHQEPAPANRPSVDESHDFPDHYSRSASAAITNAAPSKLPSGLDRLIELAGTRMGCPHEEILALKSTALTQPVMIAELCQYIFDTRERPIREAPNPLDRHRSDASQAFWVEGLHGQSIAVAPASSVLAPYDGQRLELYAPQHTPFGKLYDPEKYKARLLSSSAAASLETCPYSCPDGAPQIPIFFDNDDAINSLSETIKHKANSKALKNTAPAKVTKMQAVPVPIAPYDPEWGV